jgi:hypothetical protein
MAIAVRTDSLLAPTFTHQSLYDAVKAAFLSSGFTAVFDEFISGTDKVVVYAVVLDNTKGFGTTYLRIRVTSAFIIGQQLFGTWNPATDTGTGGSTEITYTALVNTMQVNFVNLNGVNEYKLVVIQQAANVIVLGFISPANKPVWWDLNAWNYCFIFTTNVYFVVRSTTFNPYANTEYDSILNNGRMSNANVQTNRRDLLPGIVFFTQTNQGISGRSSDDLVMLAASGTTRYDSIQIPGDTKQYLLLNPASGGLAVRTA